MADEEQESSWLIEPLGKDHDRAAFSCDREPLTEYLKTLATQDARRNVATPFAACAAGANTVIGYYTLSSLSLELTDIPPDIAKKLPRYPVMGATLLGRLAIDQSMAGQGLGEYLLMDALRRALIASHTVASVAVLTDPLDDRADGFYRHFEFRPLQETGTRLYLPMVTITKLFGG